MNHADQLHLTPDCNQLQNTGVIDAIAESVKSKPLDWLMRTPVTPKAPPPLLFHPLPVIDLKAYGGLKARRQLHLMLCHNNHDAAELYGRIIDIFVSTVKNNPRVQNKRRGAYWWGHSIENWATKCGWTYDHTNYLFKRLREWGLIASMKAKTPVSMLQVRPLVANGAAHIPGTPDASNYAELIADLKAKSLTGKGSQTENCQIAIGQKVPNSYLAEIATTNTKVLKTVVKGEQVKDVNPVPAAHGTKGDHQTKGQGKTNPTPDDLGKTPAPYSSKGSAIVLHWESVTDQKATPKAVGQLCEIRGHLRREEVGYLDPLPLLTWITQPSSWYGFVRLVYGAEAIPEQHQKPEAGLILKHLNTAMRAWYQCTLTREEIAEKYSIMRVAFDAANPE